MMRIFDKFKIPTLLGLGILIAGIIAGVLLVLQEQIFVSEASPAVEAKEISITNISDKEVVISWITSTPSTSFVSFGSNSPQDKTASDDRDIEKPQLYQIHYSSLKNLLPKTVYKYRVGQGRNSQIFELETASPITEQTGFGPVSGTVSEDNKIPTEGIAYLNIPGAIIQSALIKELGNFLIPLNTLLSTNLSSTYSLTDETVAKLTIVTPTGKATVSFKLKQNGVELPPITIGDNLDLTVTEAVQPFQPAPTNEDIILYDLNDDGKINAADNAVILNNFGNPPVGGFKNKKVDLNKDGIVDDKDLDLMSKQINQ
jgi:hypothetical protein